MDDFHLDVTHLPCSWNPMDPLSCSSFVQQQGKLATPAGLACFGDSHHDGSAS
jgi:hypothetical protein